MTRPVRPVRVLLVWAACCLAGAWPGPVHADGPTLSATFGIAGRYRAGTWCPVTVTLLNPAGEMLSGQVQVLTDPGRNRPGMGRGAPPTLFARPATLSARPGPQTFQVYTRGLDTGQDSVVVRFVEGRARGDGRTRAQADTQDTKTAPAISGAAVRDTDLLLVGFGGDPGAFTSLNGRALGLGHVPGASALPGGSNAPATAQVAEAGLADLPDKAAGYSGADAFLLRSDAPLEALTEAQADALRGWVAGGGHLVVCGGIDPARFGAAFYQGLLPASVGGARPPVTLPGAGPTGALALTPKPSPGVRVLRSAPDGAPLIVSGPYGAGRVTLTAFDPTAAGLQVPGFNLSGLWRQLLGGGLAGSAAVLPHVAGREENYHAGYFDGSERPLLSGVVVRGASLDAPGTSVIGLFLLVYLIVLVPVNYLVLKRLDRKELAWVTIPVLVLVFALGTFGVGYAAKGGAVFVNRAAIVETTAGRREAGVYSEIGLFSPRRTSYDLALPGANTLAAVPNPGFSNGFRGGGTGDGQAVSPARFVQTPEGVTLPDTSVNMWAMRSFDVQSTTDLGGTLDSALKQQRGQVTGTLTNHTAHALTDCVLLQGSLFTRLGDLAPGASVPVSLPASVGGAGRGGGLSLPGNPGGANAGDIHARMRAALTDYLGSLSRPDPNSFGPQGQAAPLYQPSPNEALLLGWSDDPALAGPSPRVDGRTVKENAVTLVIVHLPIDSAIDSASGGAR